MEGEGQRAETVMEATIFEAVLPEHECAQLPLVTAEEMPMPSSPMAWTSPAKSLAEHTAARPDLRLLSREERSDAKRAWLLSQNLSFEDTDDGIHVAWESARHRFKSGQHRQRERDMHGSSGNVRYKDALPSSVARRIRKKGAHEVAAKNLAALMGESYHLPVEKRGRKRGFKVPCTVSAGSVPSECE